MEYVKLGDIAKIVAGSTAPKENQFNDNIGLPFIRAGHLEDLCNNYDLRKLPKIDENNKNIKKQVKVPKNTIVFAKSGMSCMKSRVYQTTEECYIVNHLAGVICSENVNPSYLKYYFMVNKPNRLIVDESYPSIRLSDISNMDIYLPNLDTQQKIAEVLDKAQELIDKRKEQIEALDELVKSRFIEIFGDLYNNTKGWRKENFGEIVTIERGGSPRPINEYITDDINGINWIKIGDTSQNSMYIKSTKEKIKPEGIKKSRYVKEGDLLLSNSMSFGRPYILKTDGCIHDGWLVIRDDYSVFNKIYLCTALGSEAIYNQFKSMAVGGVVNNLNKEMVKGLSVCIPPIELQNQFADFVKQVEKLKSQMETSLKELEDNFDSLMQKAFKGELF